VVTKERQERLAREREEIDARVARFKETQEKFQREREEFFRRTWRGIRRAEPQTILVLIQGRYSKPLLKAARVPQ
jgi:hypothetical protein